MLGKNNYLAMNRLRIIISSILSGAIAGAIILGLMGRFALSIVSLSMGKSTNLSLSGMSEALIAGAIIGVVGGLFHTQTSKMKYFSNSIRNIILGTTLFAISVFVSVLFMNLRVDFSVDQIFTFITIICMYIVYGFSLDIMINRMKQTNRK